MQAPAFPFLRLFQHLHTLPPLPTAASASGPAAAQLGLAQASAACPHNVVRCLFQTEPPARKAAGRQEEEEEEEEEDTDR